MQCTWQNLARLATRWPVNRLSNTPQPFIRSLSRNIGPFFTKPLLLRTLSTSTDVASAFTRFPPPSIRQQNPIKPALLKPETTLTRSGLAKDKQTPLTSVELARAAAHAVHLSLREGNLSDACLIVNSIRYAGFGDDVKDLGMKSLEKFKAVALVFDKDVSVRLPSHALLHGLVRLKLTHKASKLAEQMMLAGVPVRCKTLEAIFHCVKENPSRGVNDRRTSMPTKILESSNVLTLKPSMLCDKGTKFAINLLIVARRSRQRRSQNMFRILIALCIVNGEIIVASLLFGILLRDWQARELTGNLENGLPIQDPMTPFPVYTHLQEICSSITHTLASDKSDVDSQFAFRTSLQALANLATMLNHQTIAYHNINPLITTLYKCPRVPDMVWVLDHLGNPKQVVAYRYFHKVLHRFILSLPTHPPAPDERNKMLPPLDIYSYNSLLHYSLRHRASTALAETILHHMIHERHEPLEPDTTTLNIIARSGTLLRDSEIANLALSKLKGNQKSFISAPKASDSSLTPSPLRSLLNIAEQRDDKYTLTARIAHLTATGQLQVVVDSLPVLFPTLTLPRDRQYSKDELRDFYRCREQDMRQSMLLGPVVFTSILNALQKSGQTGLAEKVWQWARTVEEMSWTVKVNDQFQPWCLPVLAYTIMIKLYAGEAKKAHFCGKEVDRRMSATIQKPPPFSRHVRVVGWGGDSIRGGDLPETGGPLTRSAMGRYFGMRVYRSMQSSAEAIRVKLSNLRNQSIPIHLSKRQLEIPEPDARFFTAILDIVGRDPHAPPRRVRGGPEHYRRQYRKKYVDYISRGIQGRPPDPDLLEVGRDMMAAGFEIPLLFQKFFVGRPEVGGSVDQVKPRLERDRRVFTAKKAWSPREQVGKIMIPVQNTKTLDLSSKRWSRRRRPVPLRKMERNNELKQVAGAKPRNVVPS